MRFDPKIELFVQILVLFCKFPEMGPFEEVPAGLEKPGPAAEPDPAPFGLPSPARRRGRRRH